MEKKQSNDKKRGDSEGLVCHRVPGRVVVVVDVGLFCLQGVTSMTRITGRTAVVFSKQSANTDRGLDIADAIVLQRHPCVDAANTSVESHAGNW